MPMTDEEISDLAKKIYRGEIFTSYNEGMTANLLPLVFMPLVFMSEEYKNKMIDGNVDMLYAPMGTAGPTCVNGFPVFFEFNWCSREETDKVFEKVEAIKNAVEEVTGGKIDIKLRSRDEAHRDCDT